MWTSVDALGVLKESIVVKMGSKLVLSSQVLSKLPPAEGELTRSRKSSLKDSSLPLQMVRVKQRYVTPYRNARQRASPSGIEVMTKRLSVEVSSR